MTPQVKMTLHGATRARPSYRTEVGAKLLFECAGSGYSQGTGEVSAILTENGKNTELERQVEAEFTAEEFDLVTGGTGIILPGGQWYKWIPQVSNFPLYYLSCHLHIKNTNGSKFLAARDSANITVTFPPQPLEDLFVAVTNITAPLTISLPVLSSPSLDPNTVVWEPAGNIMKQVRPSSPVLGYSVSLRQSGQAGEAVTEVELSIVRVMEEDLGVHTVTVGNGLGTHIYKVRLFKPMIAEVSIGPVSEEILVGSKEYLVCRTLGGNPPPQLDARIEVNGRKKRKLKLVEDDDGSLAQQQKKTFLLNPRVSEWSESGTVAVCVGMQMAGGKMVYNSTEARSQPLKIVFPPQAQDTHYMYAHPNETVTMDLEIKAFPQPNWSDVVWEGADSNPNYKMILKHTSPEVTVVTLTVIKVVEEDYNNRQTLRVKNQYGETNIHFWVVKPTNVWVVVGVSIGVLVLIGLCVCGCAAKKKKDDMETFSPGVGH